MSKAASLTVENLVLGGSKNTSFGEYFDNQHDAIVKAMQNKNKQLNVEWMEAHEAEIELRKAHLKRIERLHKEALGIK
jgi:hypothetical protein